MPRAGVRSSTASQTRSIVLQIGGLSVRYDFLQVPGTEALETGEIMSSRLYGIFGETGKKAFRQGGVELQFDPPRLRTSYEIQDITVQLPFLELVVEDDAEASEKIRGTFGWLVILNVGGAPYYAEPIPSETINLPKGTTIQYKQPQVVQLQFSQSIIVSQGSSVSLQVLAFLSVTSGEVPAASILSSPGEQIAHPGSPSISATMVYTQESPRGHQR